VSSLDEVRAVLAAVAADVRSAYELAGRARAELDEVVGVLRELGVQNAQPLPPPQLLRAVEELDRGLTVIGAGAAAVTDIAARL
jgi:hypothetical protein